MNKKGFTLIELIVVISLLAVIISIAIPKYGSVKENAIVKADMNSARNIIEAVKKSKLMGDAPSTSGGATLGPIGWSNGILLKDSGLENYIDTSAVPQYKPTNNTPNNYMLMYQSNMYYVLWLGPSDDAPYAFYHYKENGEHTNIDD